MLFVYYKNMIYDLWLQHRTRERGLAKGTNYGSKEIIDHYRQPQKDWVMHLQQQRKDITDNSQQRWFHFLPIELAVSWRYWGLSPCISVFNWKEFSRKAHSSAVNLAKE